MGLDTPPGAEAAHSGSLTVIGTGVVLGAQLTPQARVALDLADEVFYLAADPVTSRWLEQLKPGARPLSVMYRKGRTRRESYEAMVEEILASVRGGAKVCAAFYGHPGVFVYPGNEAIHRARKEGFHARMLPAVSSLDCLFADLEIDPARTGCQIYGATEFLANRSRPDTSAMLILLQISVVRQPAFVEAPDWSCLPLLVEYLESFYPPTHEVMAYEASPYVVGEPIVERTSLSGLPDAELTPYMTLVVPPSSNPPTNGSELTRVGMEPD